MNKLVLFNNLIPFLLPIILGICLKNIFHAGSGSILPVIRYILLPVVLYHSLLGRVSFNLFMWIAVPGAVIAALGVLVSRFGERIVRVPVSASAGFPNVAYFTIPFLALTMGSRGMGTSASLFIGVTVAFLILRARDINIGNVIKEPWIYAVILAFIFTMAKYNPPHVSKAISPLVKAAYPIMLIYLGTFIATFRGVFSAASFATVVARYVLGMGVVLLSIKFLPIPPNIHKLLMIGALAPPAAVGATFGMGSDSSLDQNSARLGTIISIIMMGCILMLNWKPWAMF